MLRLLSIAALTAVTVTTAAAQNLSAIKARQDILDSFGKVTKEPGGMLKGEVPFDLAKVKAALKTYQEGVAKLPALFPDDARTGGETEALPVIWERKKDFEDRFAALAAKAKAAEVSITDEVSFASEFPQVVSNCGGCHKIYREKK